MVDPSNWRKDQATQVWQFAFIRIYNLTYFIGVIYKAYRILPIIGAPLIEVPQCGDPIL